MANYFKTDDSFLKKLAVGAAGTNATIARLREMGFKPIELERGSTGFKIWKKIKIKRVRVPDVLCLDTGLRFESRGKTKLEISMSHSLKDPKRAWDAGMRDDDFATLSVFEQNDDAPIELKRISPVYFISFKDLRSAFNGKQISITKPKGVEEGSEIRVVWTSALAAKKSEVIKVQTDSIQLKDVVQGTIQTVKLRRNQGNIILKSQIKVGDIVEPNQIVASVVPIYTSLPRPPLVDETSFIQKLTSVNLSERYAAAKALRYRGYVNAKPILTARMTDSVEDIYVQLEAAAALAAHDYDEGWEFIENKIHSPILSVPLETQLESIIVASEIPKSRSERLLIEVLGDDSRDPELRAGAAWALGQFTSSSSAAALVNAFRSNPIEIKVEAARGLLKIAKPQVDYLVDLLKTSEPSKREGISWVLAKTGNFNPVNIIEGADDNLRRWMSYIIGYGKDNFLQVDIQSICKADPQVYFAASVLWQIVTSWIYDTKEF